MTDKQRILSEIDAAIDKMDMEAVDRGLEALDPLEPHPAAEDPRLFAARIMKMEKERTMKFSKKTIAVALAVAVVALTGFTVYAATSLNLFTFASGDRYATVRTTDGEMTREEARELTSNDLEPGEDYAMGAEQVDTQSFTFASVEEAQEEMEIPIVLPGNMPELELTSVLAQSTVIGEDYETRTIWVDYGDPADKAIGVTVGRTILQEDSQVTAIMQTEVDEGSQGSYRSSNGTVFTLFSESDPTGEMTARIATVETGEYSYGLITVGYSEDELESMLDTLDLSVYR